MEENMDMMVVEEAAPVSGIRMILESSAGVTIFESIA